MSGRFSARRRCGILFAMDIAEAVKSALFDSSEFDFHWFLAGPIGIPGRLTDRIIDEEFAWCRDDAVGLIWRPIISRELGKRGMGTVDPYSSTICDILELFGEKEGYEHIVRACDGVVACLLPYHWEEIPSRERHLKIALYAANLPFVAYSPDVNLSERECRGMKEVKRLMSIIPTCMRMRNAIQKLSERGIRMPTTTKDIRDEGPQYAIVTCKVCGSSYKSLIVIEGNARVPTNKCPVCEKRLLLE